MHIIIMFKVTCHGDELMPVVDHSYYLYVSNGYVIIWSIVFIMFFKTKFHRTAANKQEDGFDVNTIINTVQK